MADVQPAPQLLRVSEVAKMLSCREQHIWTMIYRRDIASCVIGKRSRRIPLQAVLDAIDEGMIPKREVCQ